MPNQLRNYPKFAFLTLPYARLELPGWGKMLQKAGVYSDSDELWANAPTVIIRGKLHGYRLKLDLRKWNERLTYFLGRYHELTTQLVIKAILQPGDSFIDVGANIGQITLLAARCVGRAGIVYAFEPNPAAFEKLQAVCIDNQLQQVKLHQCGLSDINSELILNVPNELTNMSTFGKIVHNIPQLTIKQYSVPVYCGDNILPCDLSRVTLIKIDVEGIETCVLRGLSNTIRSFQPAIITEVVAEQLIGAGGSSVEELLTIMHDLGYQAFNIDTKRTGLYHRLQLHPTTPERMTKDVLWLHPDSAQVSQLQPWIVS